MQGAGSSSTRLSGRLAPALKALATLRLQGGGLSLTLIASTPARSDAEAALAAMASHAGCERLEMDWRTTGGQPFDLMSTKRLPSLPHVRRMRVRLDQDTMARFSLPMPLLEELALPETPEMFAPFVSRAVALVPANHAMSPPFPALRRLSVTTTALILNSQSSECQGMIDLLRDHCLKQFWLQAVYGTAGCGRASATCALVACRTVAANSLR